MHSQYVQFGCGLCAPATWRNFDAGPAFWLQKRIPFLKPLLLRRGFPDYPVENIEYGDVVKGLPVASRSARAVYCSHVLEHMALEEFRLAIRNVYSYLEPGGRFRLVVPDLEFLVSRYAADRTEGAASRFMEESLLGETSLHRGLAAMPQALFGRSKHYWMWDFRTIQPELAAAGFTDIRRAEFSDCDESRFQDVEDRGRWEHALGVDCSRPA